MYSSSCQTCSNPCELKSAPEPFAPPRTSLAESSNRRAPRPQVFASPRRCFGRLTPELMPEIDVEAFLDNIRDSLAGPLSKASGFRYFDERDFEEFKQLWKEVSPRLEAWAKVSTRAARIACERRATRMSKRVGTQGCPTVLHLVRTSVFQQSFVEKLWLTVSGIMQQGTAEQLYSNLTEELPKRRQQQRIQLTPVCSIPCVCT